jgi:membrane-bound inhibitor of C-type lysozyme
MHAVAKSPASSSRFSVVPAALGALIALSLWGASTPYSSAAPVLSGVPNAEATDRPIILVSGKVNGWNVVEVRHDRGRFRMNKSGAWVERGNDGARFNFRETHRDDWSVYLVDNSRNMRLQIDLHRKMVLFAVGNGPMKPLYLINHAIAGKAGRGGSGGQAGQAASRTVVRYSCNEGIPLVVRYENIGNTSRAFFSHDSLPEMRLDQIRSGSGAAYSNGRYTLHTKGRQAVLTWDGITDVCRQD